MALEIPVMLKLLTVTFDNTIKRKDGADNLRAAMKIVAAPRISEAKALQYYFAIFYLLFCLLLQIGKCCHFIFSTPSVGAHNFRALYVGQTSWQMYKLCKSGQSSIWKKKMYSKLYQLIEEVLGVHFNKHTTFAVASLRFSPLRLHAHMHRFCQCRFWGAGVQV